MLKGSQLIKLLVKEDLNFITGIPCSILKSFLTHLNKVKKIKHILATNEGEASALAVGYYLATKKIPIIYMQNSGLANSVNPLISLLDKEVYSIPALLLISWRGQPNRKDEPEHIKMGRITLELLKLLGIPYLLLSSDETKAAQEIKRAKQYLKKNNSPTAIIIRKGILAYSQSKKEKNIYSLTREGAIKIIVDNLKDNRLIISTTGKTSRELFEYRENKNQNHQTDFYMVGSMGCVAAIALGIALEKPKKRIFVFDGDGAVLMKMGTLATVGYHLPKNFYHIIFDNRAYDSTGGQSTISNSVSFDKVASACGYKSVKTVSTKKELINSIRKIELQKSPHLFVIKVKKGSRDDLTRPTEMPWQNKVAFMKFLQNK